MVAFLDANLVRTFKHNLQTIGAYSSVLHTRQIPYYRKRHFFDIITACELRLVIYASKHASSTGFSYIFYT